MYLVYLVYLVHLVHLVDTTLVEIGARLGLCSLQIDVCSCIG
jgi:hypothetical protein